jgi:hypothetical protein
MQLHLQLSIVLSFTAFLQLSSASGAAGVTLPMLIACSWLYLELQILLQAPLISILVLRSDSLSLFAVPVDPFFCTLY